MRLEAVILPDLGTAPNEKITVSHWFVKRGEEVWEGDRLVEVVAGPVTFDVCAPVNGRLARIQGRVDDEVEIGFTLGFLATSENNATTTPLGKAALKK